jgi:hypothetical protein
MLTVAPNGAAMPSVITFLAELPAGYFQSPTSLLLFSGPANPRATQQRRKERDAAGLPVTHHPAQRRLGVQVAS